MAGAAQQQHEALWSPILALETEAGPDAATLRSYRPPDRTPTPPSGGSPSDRLKPSVVVGAPGAAAGTADSEAPTVGEGASAAAGTGAGAGAGAEGADYRLKGLLGQGGMGAVWRAEQTSLGREVALKVALSSEPASLAQFLAEARVTGRLDHANIVPVHELARGPDGVPHLVMKLVRGSSWKDLLHGESGRKLDLKDHLRTLIALCHAVAFAHERRVLHRDLKPENVMVGEFGQVFLMDWGLAVALDPETARGTGILHVAAVRSPAGTPAYMAPELATGAGAEQDERTDVYLLGACLHEVLTRRRRHLGHGVREVMRAAVISEPAVYDDAAVPRELGEIANRATAAARDRRFPSVEAFRRAVEGFLEHEQAARLAEKGVALVERLEREALDPAAVQKLEAEARFALTQALESWPDAAGARAALEALEARLAARGRELEALRDAERQRDFSAIAGRVGTVFVAAAAITAVGTTASAVIRAIDLGYVQPAVLFLLWTVLVLAVGLTALRGFGGIDVLPGSLASAHLLGTIGAVAIGAFVVAAANRALGLPPMGFLPPVAIMIGIGIAVVGLQTRRWLLAPAAAFYLCALGIALAPAYGREILGATIAVALGGIGAALRAGASLDPGKR